MALIDYIIQMRQQGYKDKQIAQALRERGYSPKQITDALSQSKIKSAVAGEQEKTPYPRQDYSQEDYSQQEYSDSAQDYGNYQQPQIDTSLITEIAEEVAEEKINELREKVADAEQSKKDFELKLNDFEKRLSQIEKMIDKLQIAVLGKIASYSKDLDEVTKELRATQETFKKVLNPTIDKVRNSGKNKSRKKKSRKNSKKKK